MGLYFRGPTENVACAVKILWFIFVDSKRPQNPRKFEPLKIYYLYGIVIYIYIANKIIPRYRIQGKFLLQIISVFPDNVTAMCIVSLLKQIQCLFAGEGITPYSLKTKDSLK